MSNLDWKVYQRPRSQSRTMAAAFIEKVDAVNYAHDRQNTLNHREPLDYTVTVVRCNRVVYKVRT